MGALCRKWSKYEEWLANRSTKLLIAFPVGESAKYSIRSPSSWSQRLVNIQHSWSWPWWLVMAIDNPIKIHLCANVQMASRRKQKQFIIIIKICSSMWEIDNNKKKRTVTHYTPDENRGEEKKQAFLSHLTNTTLLSVFHELFFIFVFFCSPLPSGWLP